jgi:hypothetical protein
MRREGTISGPGHGQNWVKVQGNRKLKVEELHSDLQCPANTRMAPPQVLW